MLADFGTVAIPHQFLQEKGLDLDVLLPNVPKRFFHDERNLTPTWPEDTSGLVSDFIRISADIIDCMPRLKVISFAGTGVNDWVDIAHATERGVAVCNVPAWGSESIAEYTFTLLLAVSKKLMFADAMARGTDWREEACRSLELRGKTIGLVGLGSIGQRVAEIAEGFGLKVLCYTRRPELSRRTAAKVEFVPLDELLRSSQILSLHVTLNDQTRGLIGARELDLLPEGAILINTARGPVVDTEALVGALRNGKLWGAGIDVFDQEPLPEEHPLKQLDNVVLSPHVAGQTDGAKYKLYAGTLSNVDAFAAGSPVNVVNPEVLEVGVRAL